METSRKKSFDSGHHQTMGQTMGNSERRRIGRIVHDERGNASLDWRDAPADYRRPVLEIESESHGLANQKAPRTFDPYACATPPEGVSANVSVHAGRRYGCLPYSDLSMCATLRAFVRR